MKIALSCLEKIDTKTKLSQNRNKITLNNHEDEMVAYACACVTAVRKFQRMRKFVRLKMKRKVIAKRKKLLEWQIDEWLAWIDGGAALALNLKMKLMIVEDEEDVEDLRSKDG